MEEPHRPEVSSKWENASPLSVPPLSEREIPRRRGKNLKLLPREPLGEHKPWNYHLGLELFL